MFLQEPKKKKKNPFKTRMEFRTDRDYGQYIKSTISEGMRVRMRCNYEQVTEGDHGTYIGTNTGSPPAQFAWAGMGGNTYWVFWHMVELLPPADSDDEEKEGWLEGERKGEEGEEGEGRREEG